MVLDSLSDSLKSTLKKITNALFVDEKLINELIKDIQRALLQSDVNVKLVLDLTKKMKERALNEEVPRSVSKKEHLVNIVYEELVNFLGQGGKVDFKSGIRAKKESKKGSFKVLLVGLFGSGKTTSAGKLGSYFKKRGVSVCMISLDTWRPAAADQLEQIGKSLGIQVFTDKSVKDPVKIYKKFEKDLEKFDLVIVDTAGRDALSDDLISELDGINKVVSPDESLLVLSADIGQAAEKQASAFHDTCGVSGVVITKLDGTAKGGGALIACAITGSPVRFIGVGEKSDDLEEFKSEGFVGRLLGMGDLEALLEKTRGAISEEEAQDIGKKLLKGDFNLVDLYEQMQAMKKMGPLNKIVDMIPGLGSANIPKDMLQNREQELEKWKPLLGSMTTQELEDPDIISGSRVDRISKGAGLPASDLRGMLKQYRQSKKMMKMLKPGSSERDMQRMMKKMQGFKGFK
ncbi:signal recognition particle receptor subunit alpha [Candidatus Woesearchaeota archaeon]|nr:signal recognition particle receptor subunit alpha [Candidatus Woesearchaeota archaeon]